MKNLKDVVLAMKETEQRPGESVWQHGREVRRQLKFILKFLSQEKGISKEIPPWLSKENFSDLAVPKRILRYALFHDCGKPYCKPDS